MEFRYTRELRNQFVDTILSLHFEGQMVLHLYNKDNELEIERHEFLYKLKRRKESFLVLIHNSSLTSNMSKRYMVPERNVQSITQANYLLETAVKETRIVVPDFWQVNTSQLQHLLNRPWSKLDVFATRL